MNEHNGYGFINSKCIREHLRKQNYRINSIQQAFLIYLSRHTITEKHRAWQYIIDNLPDMPAPERNWCTAKDSLHKVLTEYMKTENKYLEIFKKYEPGAVFTYEVLERRYGFQKKDTEWFNGCNPLTQKYEICHSAALSFCEETSAGLEFRIIKHYLDCVNTPHYIAVLFNRQGEPISLNIHLPVNKSPDTSKIIRYTDDFSETDVDSPGEDLMPKALPALSEEEYELLNDFFDDMYFDFPTPFKKGDIVCNCKTGKPFVLLHISSWDNQKDKDCYDSRRGALDMLAAGYVYDSDNGLLFEVGVSGYLDLEYYKGELSGGEKLLEYYSLYIKEKEAGIKNPQVNEYELMKLSRLFALCEAAQKEKENMSLFLDNLEKSKKKRPYKE